jgi:hypothetical protein
MGGHILLKSERGQWSIHLVVEEEEEEEGKRYR